MRRSILFRKIQHRNPDHTTIRILCTAIKPIPPKKRYAIIGAGFAGVATAWHLLSKSTLSNPVHVDLFDAYNLGAGGSGAAAGLLHPYTPKGKVLWKGLEAYTEALHLIEAAEASTQSADQFVWRHGLLRPSTSEKQSRDFIKNIQIDQETANITGARCIDGQHMRNLVKGLNIASSSSNDIDDECIGLYTPKTIVLHPLKYLHALWERCTSLSHIAATATMHPNTYIHSLDHFEKHCHQDYYYDAIVVSTGAAIDSLKETKGLLSLDLCQGYSLDMQTTGVGSNCWSYPAHAPSLLGSPYISMHGERRAIVGATQRHNISVDEAVSLLDSNVNTSSSLSSTAATDILLKKACEMWPPLHDWEVSKIRSGVRALPERTQHGSIPYIGKFSGLSESNDDSVEKKRKKEWWLVCGLGARGLVYHALLGKLVALGIMTHSEDHIPKELLRWRK